MENKSCISISSIPVFYTGRQVADSQGFSPSAAKPREVVDSWQRLGIPMDIIEPAPVSVETLCLAHDAEYVKDVLACRRSNGFGNKSPEVAESLPYTTGSLLCAAKEAIRNRAVAVSPTSGFHHACYGDGGSYCTFNGLAVTAFALKQQGLADRVGILDCDNHYGNGTDNIIKHLAASGWIQHISAGASFWHPKHAARFFECLPEWVRSFAGCDVLLYQAGADPHIEDPLGGWLTISQLELRDHMVFENARAQGIPVAWNLAGGYQTPLRKVLDIHDRTFIACAEVYGAKPEC